MEHVKILAVNRRWDLPVLITRQLGLPLVWVEKKVFADGECWVRLPESVRGKRVFIIAENTPAEKLMVLLVMIDACRRASAAEINVVVPYFGWARQDRMKGRDPVTVKLVCNLIVQAGADRLLSMHLHFPQLTSFVDIPWDHLYSAYAIIDWARKQGKKFTVAGPDYGASPLADFVARKLDMPLAILRKKRPAHNQAKTSGIMGSVKNSDVLMVDDISDTVRTMIGGCEYLGELGARNIYLTATHGLLSAGGAKRIEECSRVKKVLITNTTPMTARKKSPKIECISVHDIFAKAINAIIREESVKDLFEKELFA